MHGLSFSFVWLPLFSCVCECVCVWWQWYILHGVVSCVRLILLATEARSFRFVLLFVIDFMINTKGWMGNMNRCLLI